MYLKILLIMLIIIMMANNTWAKGWFQSVNDTQEASTTARTTTINSGGLSYNYGNITLPMIIAIMLIFVNMAKL